MEQQSHVLGKMPPKNKKDRTVSSTDQQNDACGLCNNIVTTGTSAIECAACERWFHQKCSDLTEQNINAIDGIQSILWCCKECLPAAKKFLRPKAIESIDKKLDALLESSQQHQDCLIDTETKVDNATHATTVATESIIKLSKDLSALLPYINKVAHGVVPKISSVKSTVEKMASTYAKVASTGTSKAITQNATIQRDVTAVLLIENADPSFKNSTDIKRSFSKAFPKKKLMYAFRTTRGFFHLEFASHEESKEIEETWKSTFMGTETSCRRPRKVQKNHSVIIKDVPMEDFFTDSKMTALLHESFPDATARRFVKKDQSTLNTVKIDFPNRNDMERAITNGIFLNDQYFRPNEFIEEERIPIVRCYNCQNFGHIAKTCKSAPKCGKCAGNHSAGDCNSEEPTCANCQSRHASNDPNCEAYLNHAKKVYHQKNVPLPKHLQERLEFYTSNG